MHIEHVKLYIIAEQFFLTLDTFLFRDCGVFVAVYAEYLSKGLSVPSTSFEAESYQ